MHRFLLAPALLVLALAAAPARAELVVFEDGRVVKAASYRLHSDEVEISLPGGGSYRVDLGRIERIVDDEVVVDVVRVEPDLYASSGPFDLSYSEKRRALFGTEFDAIIEKTAKEYDIDASLVSALIRAESNYQPRAISRKGARGLMQLMPATARRLAVKQPFDPASNVRGGVKYLRELVDRYGNRPELVLAAYNAGEGAVETYGGVPPYRETMTYVDRIMGWWKAGGSSQLSAVSSQPEKTSR
jgi:Transglycosylase SLT domain